MEKKLKINLPERDFGEEQIELKNKRIISEDFEKGGVLAKAIVFLYMEQPTSVSELTQNLNDYYNQDYDRTNIFRVLKKLSELHVIARASIGYILAIPGNEQKEIHKKCIEKFHNFLNNIPMPFRNHYQDVNYFWVKNGDGLKYVEWSCKLLKIKYEKEGEKDGK